MRAARPGVNAEFMQQQAVPQPRFAALAVPNSRRYVSGQSLSLIGTWVETVAQALLVLHLTRSGTVLGLTTAARYAPILLLSPIGAPVVGALSDVAGPRYALALAAAACLGAGAIGRRTGKVANGSGLSSGELANSQVQRTVGVGSHQRPI